MYVVSVFFYVLKIKKLFHAACGDGVTDIPPSCREFSL